MSDEADHLADDKDRVLELVRRLEGPTKSILIRGLGRGVRRLNAALAELMREGAVDFTIDRISYRTRPATVFIIGSGEPVAEPMIEAALRDGGAKVSDAQKIVDALKRRQRPMSRTELRAALGSRISSRDLDHTLWSLSDQGMIYVTTQKADERGGRPTSVIRLIASEPRITRPVKVKTPEGYVAPQRWSDRGSA